ncbi:DeoR/GlpR family DNA-binding transcription regulator [Paenibacillus sp. FJAT-26967]|uniref:DeoR/GlpR family DNA-binding transcription regulator n=1 Tax=Paenibacillus sp. FJAT-26967 TaxID=1729690 RepID=UPI000838DDE0|nr:DeoR/GlpR family DNA-binding transcription regulator [Paenibacillus sp. FJAT-26967]
MYQEERMEAIMAYLREHRRVEVREICELYHVSRDTARRDLVRMEELGWLVRTRGGAILPTLHKDVGVYKTRLQTSSSEKKMIGRAAAGLIRDGHYLFLDTSTTVLTLAEQMTGCNNVIVTNSIDIADRLTDKESVQVYLLGGQLEREHRYLCGSATLAQLSEYYADTLFLGACGITADGLTYPHDEDGAVKREMIRRADRVIVLADHTKFGKRMFYKVASLDDVDIVVTDRAPEEDMLQLLERHSVELIIVREEEQHD